MWPEQAILPVSITHSGESELQISRTLGKLYQPYKDAEQKYAYTKDHQCLCMNAKHQIK